MKLYYNVSIIIFIVVPNRVTDLKSSIPKLIHRSTANFCDSKKIIGVIIRKNVKYDCLIMLGVTTKMLYED